MPRPFLPACIALLCAPLAAGGLGLGVQTSYDLAPGAALVPRVDFLNTTSSSTAAGPGTTINLSATENILSLALDYDWFAGGRTEHGFFLLGGLGVATGFLSVKGSSSTGTSASATTTSTVLFPEVGLGYMFPRRLGFELVYKGFQFKDVNLSIDGGTVAWSSSGVLMLAVDFRF